jgi:hypothetical protein
MDSLRTFYNPNYNEHTPINQLPGFGKDSWIRYRLNRSYTNPWPKSELDIYLCPTSAARIVPWKQAANNVAVDIASTYTNIYVAMSGGIDSEFVARTFLELGIPFTPIIFKVEDLNELDIWWAFKWCRENHIEPIVVEVMGDQWVERLITISRNYCGRFGAGNGTMSFLYDYVREHSGKLVTGAGFPEYYPDENLSYMQTRYVDSKMNNKEGYLIHEPDIIQTIMYPEMPFNFLSWTPEIVLSYVYHRDMTKTSAENKSRIMNCHPRPKNMGVGDLFFRTHPVARNWLTIRRKIGTAEAEYIGSKDEIIRMLTTGIGHDKR